MKETESQRNKARGKEEKRQSEKREEKMGEEKERKEIRTQIEKKKNRSRDLQNNFIILINVRWKTSILR